MLILSRTLKGIAANQFASRNIVKSHVRTSHQKLHVSTRMEATEIMRRFVQQRGESPVFDARKYPEREKQKIFVPQTYFYASLENEIDLSRIQGQSNFDPRVFNRHLKHCRRRKQRRVRWRLHRPEPTQAVLTRK